MLMNLIVSLDEIRLNQFDKQWTNSNTWYKVMLFTEISISSQRKLLYPGTLYDMPEKMTKKSDTSIEDSPWGVPHKMNISKHKYLFSIPNFWRGFICVLKSYQYHFLVPLYDKIWYCYFEKIPFLKNQNRYLFNVWRYHFCLRWYFDNPISFK